MPLAAVGINKHLPALTALILALIFPFLDREERLLIIAVTDGLLSLDWAIFRRLVQLYQLLIDGVEARIDGRRPGECGGRRAAAARRLRRRLGRGRRHRSRLQPENVQREENDVCGTGLLSKFQDLF